MATVTFIVTCVWVDARKVLISLFRCDRYAAVKSCSWMMLLYMPLRDMCSQTTTSEREASYIHRFSQVRLASDPFFPHRSCSIRTRNGTSRSAEVAIRRLA